MNRKADANMWWIIIGAVIALVVLIILLVIFTGKTNALEWGLLDCNNKGGTCILSGGQDKSLDCKNIGKSYSSLFSCSDNKICCLGTAKEKDATCTKPEECASGTCTSGKCA